jgi:hypothetical protein
MLADIIFAAMLIRPLFRFRHFRHAFIAFFLRRLSFLSLPFSFDAFTYDADAIVFAIILPLPLLPLALSIFRYAAIDYFRLRWLPPRFHAVSLPFRLF